MQSHPTHEFPASREAEAPAPLRCLKCWQRRDGALRWCGQKKAPTERGFSSYLEADPSRLAADRNITMRAFDAPVNLAVGSVCRGNMLPIVRNYNRTSQFLYCVSHTSKAALQTRDNMSKLLNRSCDFIAHEERCILSKAAF